MRASAATADPPTTTMQLAVDTFARLLKQLFSEIVETPRNF
jgi:hypothetical protein